ncbi:MAG: hypothetical protein L0229_11160 [Blastocatellia bacterium]|nr:hypothetical protein [Blastocatellia bacterium]
MTIYDKNANSIERCTYDRDGLLTKRHLTTFEYDEKGNRIKGVIWKCNTEDEGQPCKPREAFYTVITYHPETNGKEP